MNITLYVEDHNRCCGCPTQIPAVYPGGHQRLVQHTLTQWSPVTLSVGNGIDL